MSGPVVFEVSAARIELRAPSPDGPAAGRLLAVARRLPGTDRWVVRWRDMPGAEHVDGRDAARTALLGGVS